MVYSPDQVKLKYVVLFNMPADNRTVSNFEVDMDQVMASPCPPAQGESAEWPTSGL